MDCSTCEIPMEEYALESSKIVYRDNGEDTNIKAQKQIYVCPKCKKIIGKTE